MSRAVVSCTVWNDGLFPSVTLPNTSAVRFADSCAETWVSHAPVNAASALLSMSRAVNVQRCMPPASEAGQTTVVDDVLPAAIVTGALLDSTTSLHDASI